MEPLSSTTPILNVGPLFADDPAAWQPIDAAIGEASRTSGGFVADGLPAALRLDDERVALLHQFFTLPQEARDALGIRRYRPESSQLWRGYSATLRGGWAHNEIYDIGPAAPVPAPDLKGIQIITEPNAWPDVEPAPGWREAMVAQFQQLHTLGVVLFRSLARALGADEAAAVARFRSGYSTLRLLNYPPRPAGAVVGNQADAVRLHDGVERPLLTVEHEDACCLSLLWQDEGGGLQHQARSGEWLDVPRVPGAVSVHFGDSMGPLTDGAVVATPHRVLGHGAGGRQSLGFFLELDLDAPVAPLAGLPAAAEAAEADTYAAALLKVLVRRGQYKELIEA